MNRAWDSLGKQAQTVLQALFDNDRPTREDELEYCTDLSLGWIKKALRDLVLSGLCAEAHGHTDDPRPAYMITDEGRNVVYDRELASDEGTSAEPSPGLDLRVDQSTLAGRAASGRGEVNRSGVALLVGAGGSTPFGLPTMARFIEHLTSRIKSELNICFRTDLSLLDRILKSQAPDTLDLEQVMEATYALTQLGDPIVAKLYPNLHPDSMHIVPTSTVAGLASRAMTFLQDEIFKVYGKTLEDRVIREVYNPVLDALRNHGIRGVFTTNYDMVLDDLFYKLKALPVVNGFGEDGLGRWQGFADRPGKPCYCKLHGSLNWLRDAKTGLVAATGPPTRAASDRSKEVILYPFRKGFVSFQPFFAMFDRFWSVLRQVGLLVVAGYAMRDDLVAEPVTAEAKQAENPLTVVIVDNRARSIAHQLSQLGVPEDSLQPLELDWGGADTGPALAATIDLQMSALGRRQLRPH